MPPAPGPCPVCGYRAVGVSPSDAAAAARSYPRRFRRLLVRPHDDDPEIVHRRPAPGEPSALELAGRAADRVAAAVLALRRVRVEDDPSVDLGDGGRLPAEQPTLRSVLERLAAAAAGLAQEVEAVHGDDWQRSGRLRDGGEVSALDIAREGVHAGIHHLREAEKTLARARTGLRGASGGG